MPSFFGRQIRGLEARNPGNSKGQKLSGFGRPLSTNFLGLWNLGPEIQGVKTSGRFLSANFPRFGPFGPEIRGQKAFLTLNSRPLSTNFRPLSTISRPVNHDPLIKPRISSRFKIIIGQRAEGLGFRVWGLGLRVWALGFRVWALGFRVRF